MAGLNWFIVGRYTKGKIYLSFLEGIKIGNLMKILNTIEERGRCCSCDEVKCICRKFDGCDQCEIRSAFWLRRLNKRVEPPLLTGTILQSLERMPECFV